ncbi:MAG: AbrB/MazE/SpoVT family DNA-binding domain-containing protein [Lysobacterales bacterium]
MSTATVTSKGQITIPAAVRSSLGVDTGDRIEFVQVAPGRYEVVAANLAVTDLKGILPKPVKPLSIEDMDAAIAVAAAKAAR